MWKRFIVIGLALALGVISVTPALADEVSVTATVTPGVITIGVSPGTTDYGVMNAAATKASPNNPFTVTNNSSGFNVDLTIRGANMTSLNNTWTLGGTAGTDIYAHEFKSSTPVSYTALTTSNQSFGATGIIPTGTETFDLQIKTPTTYGAATPNLGEQMSTSVTVVATGS